MTERNGPEAVAGDAPSPANTCAVIVSYHPDFAALRRLVDTIAAQVNAVIIVDNGSGPTTQNRLQQLSVESAAVRLVLNRENLGIAAALNQGANWAVDHLCRWALLLDQDAEPMPDLLAGLRAAYDGDADGERLGTLGANFEMRQAGRLAFRAPAGAALKEVPVIPTAGTLLRLAAFREVGPFREGFFIDAVDHDHCLRLRSHGWRVAVTARPLMRHAFGQARVVRLFGRAVSYTDHPPLRRYYGARNELVLAREYLFTREIGWVMTQMRRLLQEAVMIALFESGKIAKLRAMMLGAWHFAIGRQGPLPPEALEKHPTNQ